MVILEYVQTRSEVTSVIAHLARSRLVPDALVSFTHTFRLYIYVSIAPVLQGSIPAGKPIVDDEFFSTVPGLSCDMCLISIRIKTRLVFRNNYVNGK